MPRMQDERLKFSLTALSLREMFASPRSDEKRPGHAWGEGSEVIFIMMDTQDV